MAEVYTFSKNKSNSIIHLKSWPSGECKSNTRSTFSSVFGHPGEKILNEIKNQNTTNVFSPAETGKTFVVFLKGASLFLCIHLLNINSNVKHESSLKEVLSWCRSTLGGHQWTMTFLPNEGEVICCQWGVGIKWVTSRIGSCWEERGGVVVAVAVWLCAGEMSFRLCEVANYLQATQCRHDVSARTLSN